MRSIWLGRSAISRLDRVSRLRIWGLSRLGSRHIGRRQLRLNIRGDEILAACAKSNYRDHINTNNDDTNGDASNSRTNLLGLAGTETGGILGLWNIAVAASTRVFRSRNHWIHTMTNLHANRRGDIPLFRVDKWFIIRRIITTQLGSKTSPTCYTSNTSIRVLINWIAIWALAHANTETSQDIGYLTLGFVVIVLSIHIDTLLVAGLRIGILNIRSAIHITSRVYIVISNRFLLRVDFRIVRILDWNGYIIHSSRGIISRIERMRGRWNTSTLRISLWITSISNREEFGGLRAFRETGRSALLRQFERRESKSARVHLIPFLSAIIVTTMTNPTHYYSIILCTRVFSAPTIIIPTMIRMIGRMNQKQKQHLMRDQMSQPPFPDELTLLDLSRSKYHSQCVRLIEFTILSGLLTGPDWPSFSPISTLIDKIWICDSLKTGSPIRI